MSVLIKDMEKPKSCYAVIDGEAEFCPFVNTDDDCVLLLKKGICVGTWADQYSKCPLAEEPERKKGRWIYGEKSGQDGWYCSECGGFIPWYYDFYGLDNIDFIEDFKTCPFCDSKMVSYTGADMRGDSDDL